MNHSKNPSRGTRIAIISVLLLGFLAFTPSVFASQAAPQAGGTSYTVKDNDTLGSIALAHRVTVASILAANPSITNPRFIFKGEKLTIPAANLAAGQSIWSGFNFSAAPTGGAGVPVTGPTTYTVRANDTLGTIALAHRVTVVSILQANPSITNPRFIFAGERLNLPAANLNAGQSIWSGYNFTATGQSGTGAGSATSQPGATSSPSTSGTAAPGATSSPSTSATAQPSSTAAPTQAMPSATSTPY